MSRNVDRLDRKPFISLADKAASALGADMVRQARERGHSEIRLAHNAVFATLYGEAARTSDMAARAGITKQSMGEVVRELAELGLVEVKPDPDDRRAKLVAYTEKGIEVTTGGRRYLEELEERFAEEFGEEKYEHAREVLEKVIELFDPTFP